MDGRRPATGRRYAAAFALLFVLTVAGGCAGATLVPITPPPPTPTPEPTPTPAPPTPTAAPVESGQPAPSTPAPPVEVALKIDTAKGAEDFHYKPEQLAAPAGSTITLTLNNLTNPDDEIGHNWVLVKPGQEDSVLASGIAAGDDRDWLDKKDPGIIAATGLIEGDDSAKVKFDAPEPGTYTFVCTFPDHYKGGMQGTLVIS
jgi:azurin